MREGSSFDGKKVFEELMQGIMRGRPQTVKETASAALFLVCDQSSPITGPTLNVHGGMTFC